MANYDGVGGSYVVDPKTGERKLVERTEEKAPAKAPSPVKSEVIKSKDE